MAQVPVTDVTTISVGGSAYTIPFPYQNQTEVFVEVDGVATAFTWINRGNISIVPAPAPGAKVHRYRSTTASSIRHDFRNGVPFTPKNIAENNDQLLYVVQEAVNGTAGTAAEALSIANGALVMSKETRDLLDAAILDSAAQLRIDLLDPAEGSDVVAYNSTRTVKEHLDDIPTVKDYGALGDGVAIDTAALAAAPENAYIPSGSYLSTEYLTSYNKRYIGPGQVVYNGTNYRVGDQARIGSHSNPKQAQLRHSYNRGEGSVTRMSLLSGPSTSIPSVTFTTMSLAHVQEGAGVFFPNVSASSIFAPARAKVITISGQATFASAAGTVRSVALRKNGVAFAQVNVPVVGAGLETSAVFSFTVECMGTDYFDLQVYHDAGANVAVTLPSVLVEVKCAHPYVMGGQRLLIYQGSWTSIEASYGSYNALLDAVCQYDVLALSHIETFGALPYPMLPNPNGIMDVGYAKLKQLIIDYKFRRPDGLVFGYVSAAIDAPTWDAGGNPTNNTWTSTNYPNFRFWCNLWLNDRHLPIDGFFLDHYNAAFMSAVARDAVSSIVKQTYGKKIMGNITSASINAVRWAAECEYLSYGDYLCLEGFYRDNGVDVLTETNALLSELAKHEARGLLLAAVNEGAAATPINNGSVDNLNGVSLFNTFYKPGWCYQYGRVTYDTIGTPGI